MPVIVIQKTNVNIHAWIHRYHLLIHMLIFRPHERQKVGEISSHASYDNKYII